MAKKFCRLCYLSGSQAYTTHDISTCRQLTHRDLEALQGRLNCMTLEESTEEPPEPLLVPGWDILEDEDEDASK
jgi:hypothetical protein